MNANGMWDENTQNISNMCWMWWSSDDSKNGHKFTTVSTIRRLEQIKVPIETEESGDNEFLRPISLRFFAIFVFEYILIACDQLDPEKNPFKNKISAFNVSQRVWKFMVDAFWPGERRKNFGLYFEVLFAWNICVKCNWDVNRASEVWAVRRRANRHKFLWYKKKIGEMAP